MQQGHHHTLPATRGPRNSIADMHTPRRCGLFWDCVHVPWALDPPATADRRTLSANQLTISTFFYLPLFAFILAAATIRAAVAHDRRPARLSPRARPSQNDDFLPVTAQPCTLTTRCNANVVAGKKPYRQRFGLAALRRHFPLRPVPYVFSIARQRRATC